MPSGPQNLLGARGQGWGTSPCDPAALSLPGGDLREPPSPSTEQKPRPARRHQRLLQLLMPSCARSRERGLRPGTAAATAGSPPPEGHSSAENKQTLGVNGAAVIFGLGGVHTLRVVLANSCKWSGERGWLRALGRAGLGAPVPTGNLSSFFAPFIVTTSHGKVAPGSVPRREGTAPHGCSCSGRRDDAKAVLPSLVAPRAVSASPGASSFRTKALSYGDASCPRATFV